MIPTPLTFVAFLAMASQAVHAATASSILRIEASSGLQQKSIEPELGALFSDKLLNEVSTRLALPCAWNLEPSAVRQRLTAGLALDVTKQGARCRIQATDKSPAMAMALANAAASVLRDHFEKSSGRREQLEREIAVQRDRVSDRWKLLSQIRRTEALPRPEKPATQDSSSATEARDAEKTSTAGCATFVDADGDYEASESELAEMVRNFDSLRGVTIQRVIWAKAAAT